jgi:predicted nucleic acid-binding protein
MTAPDDRSPTKKSIPSHARAREDFRAAARFADQSELNLRSGDALHLAICANHGALLCTLDRRLAESAPRVGVPVREVTPPE